MVNPVQSFTFVPRSAPPVFNEGAASTASKVVAFIAAAIASLASFIFLPAEAALMVSTGAAAILSMLCCIPNDGAVRDDAEPRRWYHPVVDAFHVFVPRGAVPVVHEGPRVPVGGVVQPYLAPLPLVHRHDVGQQEGPRAQVGHRGPVAGVAVMPQAQAPQPAVQPVVQPVVHRAPGAQQQPQARVPVGHRP